MKRISRNWVFNEADTLKSSSILIYSISEQSIYTQNGWHKAVLIKWEIKRVTIGCVDNCCTFTSFNQANLISEG